MELRYCEECGDVIQVETSEPVALSDHFVCERCKSGASEPRGEATPKEDLQAQSLNLFSPETIAIRRKKVDEEPTAKKPKSSRLKLVKANPGDTETRAAETDRAPAPPVAGASPAAAAPLPSAASLPAAQSAPAAPAGSAGSAAPAKSARRILFRCLHCRSTLSIRPVEKTSKLTCPHCTNVIYVTPSGRLLKNSPSVALRKGEVAPTELLTAGAGSGMNPAAAVIQRNPASVAIRKTGSVAVPRRAGSSVGLRPTAYKEPVAPGGRDKSGARFQRTEAGGNSRRGEAPQQDVGLASVNPATGWMPKPASAFQEHEDNQDPGKTAFLTEERTGDLSDLTSSPALAGVAEQFALPDLRNAPPAPSPRLGALLPDDGENGLGPALSAGSHTASNSRRRPLPVKPGARFASRQDRAGHAVRGLFLLVCLCAPLLVAGLVLTKHADAAGGLPDEPPPVQSGMLERLGRIAEQGVRHIVGPPTDPYAE
jgi:hypothetical protein